MDLQLAGLRALVTGGTKGIGRAIVEGLLAEGVDVAFCARTESDVKATVEALADSGPRVLGETLNVADGPALTSWVGRVAEEFGGLDIVVCNVSAIAIGHDEATWQTNYDVDLMHTVRVVNAALPHLERSDSGNVVVVSSVSAREIDFASAAYGATKAALVHYTQGLAFEFAPKGIRANCVSPGNTSFPGGVWDQLSQNDPAFYETALALNPTGRMGKPEEMAYAVTMLASPRASFISGTNVVVDGALTRGVQL
jgi:NAD(P)-dependent dehydrogenase (short-subunit alcohol dehydrogenase family)